MQPTQKHKPGLRVKKGSLPLYDPFGSGGDDLLLSNFFSPLAICLKMSLLLPEQPVTESTSLRLVSTHPQAHHLLQQPLPGANVPVHLPCRILVTCLTLCQLGHPMCCALHSLPVVQHPPFPRTLQSSAPSHSSALSACTCLPALSHV